MANLFDTFKTFRPRRTILSDDFNLLQTALTAAFAKIGTAPPGVETGVSSTFHCADPTDTQHAVTKGYYDSSYSATVAPHTALAESWADAAAASAATAAAIAFEDAAPYAYFNGHS